MSARNALSVSVLCGFVATVLGFVQPAGAQAPAPRAGLEYRLVPPQPVSTGKNIEVIDFFWYGCPFCYELQPALEAWIQRQPPDVVLRRIPAILRGSWAPHARIYYTLEALGEIDRLHQQVYHGYHVEKLRMSLPEVMEEWAVGHGIDRDKWVAAYRSPETDQKVSQAQADVRRYTVSGTPSIVVDGRYLTSSAMAETVPGVIPIVEQLIERARNERAARQ